jgi:hypothetical protein
MAGTKRYMRNAARSIAFFSLLFAVSSLLSAQSSRGDIKIFIPRPVSNTGVNEQQDFFAEQFKMEISAANYTVTDKREEADYLVQLTVDNNEYYGEPDEKKYIVTLALTRTEDNKEIVRFSWPFTEMNEMYQWNLYLVYQAMANVPLTKDVDDPSRVIVEREIERALASERWRDQWLYTVIGGSLDAGFLVPQGDTRVSTGMVMGTVLAGIEFQFLDFMSLEFDPLKVRLLDNGENQFISLAFPLLLKGALKFSAVMLEPYAGAEVAFGLGGTLPLLSGIWGVQLAFRCSDRSALLLDFNATAGLIAPIELSDGNRYSMVRFSFGAGWKIGRLDRKKRTPPSASADSGTGDPAGSAATTTP